MSKSEKIAALRQIINDEPTIESDQPYKDLAPVVELMEAAGFEIQAHQRGIMGTTFIAIPK